jgi:hypothetical protein
MTISPGKLLVAAYMVAKLPKTPRTADVFETS